MKILLAGLVVICFACAAGDAFAINCGAKGSPVDAAICRDAKLRQMDSDLNSLYGGLRQQLTPKAATELRTQQRAWVADRDHHCASADAACLQAMYEARLDQLAALDADAKVSEGKLAEVKAIVVKGNWKAGSVRDPAGAGAKDDASLRDSLANAELPALGNAVSLTAGKMCIAPDPCRAMSWKRNTVQRLENGNAISRVLGVSPSAEVYVGRTDASAAPAYVLIPNGNGKMQAIFALCGANATNCRNAAELWEPTGAPTINH